MVVGFKRFLAAGLAILLVALTIPTRALATSDDTADIPDWLSEAAVEQPVDLHEALETTEIDLSAFEDYEGTFDTLGGLEAEGLEADPYSILDSEGVLLEEVPSEMETLAAGSWKRLAGATRYDTMASVVKESFPQGSPSGIAILATGDTFPDALAASSLAGAIGAPIILTSKAALSHQAEKQIDSLGIKRVLIIGSSRAVSTAVENKLVKKLGRDSVSRCYGSNRFETAYEIYRYGEKINAWGNVAFIATGDNFPDALSVGPIAFRTRSPIFLYSASSKSFDPQQLKALKSGRFKKVILLGSSAVLPESIRKDLGALGSKSTCFRLAGSDRHLTSLAIAEFGIQTKVLGNGTTSKYAALATGTNFPDALSGAALCGRLGAPLYLVDDSPRGRVGMYRSLARSALHGTLKEAYVLGSDRAVPASILSKAKGIGSTTAQEEEVVNLVNKERRKAGLPALRVLPILQGTCDIRADELTMRYVADHTRPYKGSNGKFLDCFSALEVDLAYGKICTFYGLGENIAYGYRSPAAVVAGWMDSTGHRGNILNPNWKYIGVGKSIASDGTPYWVQFFAC